MSKKNEFSEKREHTREEQQHGVYVKVLPDAESVQPHVMEFECVSQDLSASGIRLHGSEGLVTNSLVHLVVDTQEDNLHYNLLGQVVWTTETTEHEHLCGLRLTESAGSDLEKWQARFS